MAFLKGINFEKLGQALDAGVKAAGEALESGAKAAGEAIDSGIKAAQEGADALAKGAADLANSAAEGIAGKSGDSNEELGYAREFVSLLWYLACVDGEVTGQERDEIERLGSLLLSGDECLAADLEEECVGNYEAAVRDFGSEVAAKIAAQRTVEAMTLSHREAKLLCWNLLAVANSDSLEASELAFIQFCSEKAGVSEAEYQELRNYSCALVELAAEQEALKASDRNYATIEPLLNELVDRQETIITAAQALIEDM